MLAVKPLAVARQVFGESPTVLGDVLQDGVNMAVWQRRLPAHIEDFVRLLLSLNEPLAESLVIELQADAEAPALAGLAQGYADLQGHAGFIADLRWLVSAYACLLDARWIGLRLRVLDQAMCPRFHVDHVPLRLITTYGGPASEWLQGTQAQQLATGDVALLKGEKWSGNEGAGLVHRSPALAKGERRLILTLDWMA